MYLYFQGVRDLLRTILEKCQNSSPAENVAALPQVDAVIEVELLFVTSSFCPSHSMQYVISNLLAIHHSTMSNI